MKPDQALEILMRAASQYRGTLEEHQMLQEALRVIQEKIVEKPSGPKLPKGSNKVSK